MTKAGLLHSNTPRWEIKSRKTGPDLFTDSAEEDEHIVSISLHCDELHLVDEADRNPHHRQKTHHTPQSPMISTPIPESQAEMKKIFTTPRKIHSKGVKVSPAGPMNTLRRSTRVQNKWR